MSSILPQQKVTKAERTEQWYKDNANYRIDQSNFWSSDKWEMMQCYKAAAGNLDKTAYKYVLNPYDSTDENLTNYPAALRNMDIIGPILNSFMGERANLPFNHKVISVNPGSPNKSKEAQDNEFSRVLAQHYVNELNSSGIDTGVPTQQIPPYQKIIDKYNKIDNVDKRALFGQEALDYIKYNLSLKDKFQEAYYDWLVTGKCFTYKDIAFDDLQNEIVPTLEINHGTTKTGFIEDAEWVVRRTRFNLSNMIDRFRKDFNDAEITALEEKFRGGLGTSILDFNSGLPNIDKAANIQANTSSMNGDMIDVYHIVWKGFVKVGILKFRDSITGQINETEVSEEYILDKENGDVDIEWEWDTQVYETYKMGDTFYKCMRPILCQRNQLSNSSVTKLPYNGRIGYNERGTINSTVKQLVPYQALYNIYHFRRELILARNKDKIMLMPIGLIPDEFGTGTDGMSKYLHFIETTGLAFFDEQKEGAMAVLNAIKAIDLSLGQYIIGMTQLIASIKQEAWDSVGMNRQRYGEVNSSDGKGVNEQAILQSATITREMNRRFEKFVETDLQGLIDYSKLAWINGKKGMYINSEGRKAFLEVDPEAHLDTDYGVFAVDSIDEDRKLNQAREYAFGWAQKTSNTASLVLDVLDSNNMANLKMKIADAEQIEKEYQQSLIEQQNKSTQDVAQLKAQQEDKKLQNNIDIAIIQTKGAANVANINGMNKDGGEESPENQTGEAYESYIEKLRKQSQENQKKGESSYNEISNRRLKEADLALKEKKMENDLKVAKANKNKYDK